MHCCSMDLNRRGFDSGFDRTRLAGFVVSLILEYFVVDFAVGLAVRKGFLFDWGFQSRQSFSLESKQAVGTMMKLEPMVDFAPVGVLVEAAS
jgi:hypothetical protein